MASRQLAARRFFSTFYRWDKLTHPAVSCPHRTNFCSSRTSFATPQRWFSGSYIRPQSGETTAQVQHNGEESGQTEDSGAAKSSEIIRRNQKTYNLRQLMRHIAYPAVIVTAGSVDAASQTFSHQAMTVSSFNTVSLDPEPIVSLNIRMPSRTLDAIKSSGRFIVHIPTSSERTSSLVDAFARNNALEAFQKIERLGARITPRFDKDSKVQLPVIDSPDMMAILTCDLVEDKMMTVNDHVIVIAKVARIENKGLRKHDAPSALLYMKGNYRDVGRKVGSHLQGTDASSKEAPPVRQGVTMVDLPCFPGPQEAQSLRDAIRDWASKHRDYIFSSKPPEVRAYLEKEFRLHRSALGINVLQVLYNLGASQGYEMSPWWKDYGLPEMSKYWGLIMKKEIPEIVQQAKSTLEQNPDILSLDYRQFLCACNISPRGTDAFLVGDLMDGFRQAGVLGPRKYSNSPRSELEDGQLTIEKAEEAEIRFRASMISRSGYQWHITNQIRDLAELIKSSDTEWGRKYLHQVFPTLIVEHSPERYNPSLFDFHGEVTKEQSQIIMDRVLDFILEDSNVNLRLSFHNYRILEGVNVHPHTKFDIGFLKHKLRWLVDDGGYSHLRKNIWKIRTEYGLRVPLKKVGAVITRIRSFIDEDPSRAAQLGIEGILRELSIYSNATMPYRGLDVPLKTHPFLTALLGGTTPANPQAFFRKLHTTKEGSAASQAALEQFQSKRQGLSTSLSDQVTATKTQESQDTQFSIKELSEARFDDESDARGEKYWRFMHEESATKEAAIPKQESQGSEVRSKDAEHDALLAKFGEHKSSPESEERS